MLHEALVQHAFMCRMLIDEHDTVVMLVEEVGATKLNQRRNGDVLGDEFDAFNVLAAFEERRDRPLR